MRINDGVYPSPPPENRVTGQGSTASGFFSRQLEATLNRPSDGNGAPASKGEKDFGGYMAAPSASERAQSGGGHLLQFPPANAPDSVKRAWSEVTQGMSDGELLDAQTPFLLGNPADLDGATDYRGLLAAALESANFSKQFDQSWQQDCRAKQIAFLERFRDALQ